jgi:uncharacterized protein (DUF427 family)
MRIEQCKKRVRVFFGGEAIADSTRTKLAWEVPHYPAYYFPIADVRMERVVENGDALDVRLGDRVATNAARRVLDDHVRFKWDRMDAWFEEEEEVFVHAHDPYKRIDMLHATRHIEVLIDGVKVADSRRPTIVYETGAAIRYYVPKTDVRMDLLEPTDLRTGCAYKGFARYWSVNVPGGKKHENIVWSYATPIADCAKIAGLVSFYNEHVDVMIDGVREERPKPEE